MTATNEWKCAGCGAPSPNRSTVCGCLTICLYRVTDSEIEHSTKRPTYAFDSKCFDLAEHFFTGDKDDTSDLAQTIQDAIEDWLGDRERAAISKARKGDTP